MRNGLALPAAARCMVAARTVTVALRPLAVVLTREWSKGCWNLLFYRLYTRTRRQWPGPTSAWRRTYTGGGERQL